MAAVAKQTLFSINTIWREHDGAINAIKLAEQYDIEIEVFYGYLGITRTTLLRSPSHSPSQEKLEQIERLLGQIERYCRTLTEVRTWLRKINRDLGISPINLIKTGQIAELQDYVNQAEAGSPQ
jgi:hypothetical protein